MPLPTPQKVWTISPNVRETFSTLNDAMAAAWFNAKNFLVATMGNPVAYSSNGTTGPTGPTDHTDRIITKANFTTRAANRYQAQSWAVITDGNGAQLLFSYLGATDDVGTLRYSPGALYAPATGAAAALTITAFSTVTSNLTSTAHGQVTGNGPFYFATAGFPSAFAQDVPYWVIFVDANNIRLATSQTNANNGIFITVNGTGSPPATLTNGGPAEPPTAPDEVIVTTGSTIIFPTASNDRVFHFWSSSDKKMFRMVVWRASANFQCIGVEQITSAVVSPAVLSPPIYGFIHNSGSLGNTAGMPHYTVSGAQGTSGYLGAVARPHSSGIDQTIPIFGICPFVNGIPFNVPPYSVEKPELQGASGELMYLLQKGSSTATAQGVLGTCIDWWISFAGAAATPPFGDFMGTLQFVSVGGPAIIWPWDGATTQFQTA